MKYYKKLSTRLKHDIARYEHIKEMGKLEDELCYLKPSNPEYGEKLKRYLYLEQALIVYDRIMGYNAWQI